MKFSDPRQVFGLAILVSIALLALGIYAVLLCWYPPAFWRASGVLRMMMYALAAHVVVTMLLLIPWRNRKRQSPPSMRHDVIWLVFLLVLTWLLSLSFLAQGRPVALVFTVDRITLVRANELRSSEFALPGGVPIGGVRWSGKVPLLAARPSTDAERLNSIALAMEGYDLPQRPSRWEMPERQRAQISGRVLRAPNSQESDVSQESRRWLGRLPLDAASGEWQVLVSDELNDYWLESSTGH
ncbi:hypothetical protein [Hydrogenophaga sp. 2FB]|uniref:hypothetical protein n=1 Tax=Hydrogenophaga sp. 2FB TaxID=2502187 RepID=UPI0010F50F1F|nr:hypothetical protein [Hydrogenophaga sp. 2FB]